MKALFSGAAYNSSDANESVQTILDRYKDIQAFALADELGAGLETFIYWLMNNVGLIEIATETDEHAYAIFETMNDRGKPLSPVDMMKAFLLGGIDDGQERTTANQIWKRTISDLISWGDEPDPERDSVFVKAWLRARHAESIRDRKAGAVDKDWELIGTAFHRWIRDSGARMGAGTPAGNNAIIRKEIPFFARWYGQILDSSVTYTPGLEAVFYNAHNDFTWQPTVLLAALNPEDDDDTARRKVGVVSTYLDIWLMRRVVNYIRVGYSSVNYAMWLLCKEIRGKSLNDLINLLTARLTSDDVHFDGSGARSRLGVIDLRLNQFSRRYIFHLLARVTAFVDQGFGKPDMFDKYVDRSSKNPYDIEHIWANNFSEYQSFFSSEADFETARNNIGGLLLLPADVNRSYQDKAYQDKAPHYAKQNSYAASLTESAYIHQPQFKRFIGETGLEFEPYRDFDLHAQTERRNLVLAISEIVWSPGRLDEYRL